MKIPRSLKNRAMEKYIAALKKNKCEITKIVNDPVYLNGEITPICFLEFIKDGYIYLTLLEFNFKGCLTNFRVNISYEKLYRLRNDFKEFRGVFPILVITTENKSIRYNSKNFEVVYTDLEFNNLDKFLF
ncbi:hypothetical protein [Caproiciproducens sp. MSJ-32]|uniref:hypothetical protein n=1 Tax=Caproiciproducens sp. MSJ-32 TaxID=2841527 RepID=UPI001C10C52F|nr:hypothetical protein [Caproiciproducens sp. MSJ-32]MBU5453876.1 hypothetical protein [Caproiciproducens sp. MSJ-32]